MIESETVKNRGLEIVNMDRVLDDMKAEVIGSPIGESSADTATSEPH